MQDSGKGIGWLRGGAEKAGFRTGPVGAWVYTVQASAVDSRDRDSSAGAGLLESADREGDHRLTLAVLVALVIIEFLGRPPSPAAPEPPEAETPAATPEGSDAPLTGSVAVGSSQANDTSEADVRG